MPAQSGTARGGDASSSGESIKGRSTHDARLLPPSQEHRPIGCQQDACQRAKSSYDPNDHAEFYDPKSGIIREQLIDDLVVDQSERSCDLLVQRICRDPFRRHRCENAAICHDWRCSSKKRSNHVLTLSADFSSCTQRKPNRPRNMIKETRSECLNENAHAVKQLLRTRRKDVAEESKSVLMSGS